MTALNLALLSALAVLVGSLIPIQAATNAALSRAIGSPSLVALIIFAIGLTFLAVWIVVSRPPLPSVTAYREAPLYGYLGGVIVACYVLAITFLTPRLGVGNAICFIVTGQIVAAVIIDHFGLFGAVIHAITWQRTVGLILMVAGLFLAKRS